MRIGIACQLFLSVFLVTFTFSVSTASLLPFHPTSPLRHLPASHVTIAHFQAPKQASTAERAPLKLHAFGVHISVSLTPNRELFAPNYREELVTASGEVVESTPLHRVAHRDCHFTGKVTVTEGGNTTLLTGRSHAVLSSCAAHEVHGVVFHPAVGQLEIVPAYKHVRTFKKDSQSGAHVVFKQTHRRPERAFLFGDTDDDEGETNEVDLNELSEAQRAHVRAEVARLFELMQSHGRPAAQKTRGASRTLLQENPAPQDGTQYFIPLTVVNDDYRLADLGEDVWQDTVAIVARVDAIYKYNFATGPNTALLRVMIRRQVTLRDNVFDGLEPNATASAECFSKGNTSAAYEGWTRSNIVREDTAEMVQHFIHRELCGSLIGFAYRASLCGDSAARRVGVNQVDFTTDRGRQASLVAHELGHNVAFHHDIVPGDDNDSECDPTVDGLDCTIMNPSLCTTSEPEYTFSTCSRTHAASLIAAWDAIDSNCLPSQRPAEWDVPSCGNGVVDAGEECDCGASQYQSCAEYGDPCCTNECTLAGSASCSPQSDGCCHPATCAHQFASPNSSTTCSERMAAIEVRTAAANGYYGHDFASDWDTRADSSFSFSRPYFINQLTLKVRPITSANANTYVVFSEFGQIRTRVLHADVTSAPFQLFHGVNQFQIVHRLTKSNTQYTSIYQLSVTIRSQDLPSLLLSDLIVMEQLPIPQGSVGAGKAALSGDLLAPGEFLPATTEYHLEMRPDSTAVRVRPTLEEPNPDFDVTLHVSYTDGDTWLPVSSGSIAQGALDLTTAGSRTIIVRTRFLASAGILEVRYFIHVALPEANSLLAAMRVLETNTDLVPLLPGETEPSEPEPEPDFVDLSGQLNFSPNVHSYNVVTGHGLLRLELEQQSPYATIAYFTSGQQGATSEAGEPILSELIAVPVGASTISIVVHFRGSTSGVSVSTYALHVQRTRPPEPVAYLGALHFRTGSCVSCSVSQSSFVPTNPSKSVSMPGRYWTIQIYHEVQDERATVQLESDRSLWPFQLSYVRTVDFSPYRNTWTPSIVVDPGTTELKFTVRARAQGWEDATFTYTVPVTRTTQVTKVQLFNADDNTTALYDGSDWNSRFPSPVTGYNWQQAALSGNTISVDATVTRVYAEVVVTPQGGPAELSVRSRWRDNVYDSSSFVSNIVLPDPEPDTGGGGGKGDIMSKGKINDPPSASGYYTRTPVFTISRGVGFLDFEVSQLAKEPDGGFGGAGTKVETSLFIDQRMPSSASLNVVAVALSLLDGTPVSFSPPFAVGVSVFTVALGPLDSKLRVFVEVELPDQAEASWFPADNTTDVQTFASPSGYVDVDVAIGSTDFVLKVTSLLGSDVFHEYTFQVTRENAPRFEFYGALADIALRDENDVQIGGIVATATYPPMQVGSSAYVSSNVNVGFTNGGGGILEMHFSVQGGDNPLDWRQNTSPQQVWGTSATLSSPTFFPTGVGLRNALWLIHTNDPTLPDPIVIQLEGSGVAPSPDSATCGNGVLEAGEQCDSATGDVSPGCSSCSVTSGYSCSFSYEASTSTCAPISGGATTLTVPTKDSNGFSTPPRIPVSFDASSELGNVELVLPASFAADALTNAGLPVDDGASVELTVQAVDGADALAQAPAPPGTEASDLFIDLDVEPDSDGTFSSPVLLQLQVANCSDAPVVLLYDEDLAEWTDAAATCAASGQQYSKCVDGVLTVNICHFTRFGVFTGEASAGCTGDGDCGACEGCDSGVCRAVEGCCEQEADCGDCETCRGDECVRELDCCVLDSDCGSPCQRCGRSNKCEAVPDCCVVKGEDDDGEDCAGTCEACVLQDRLTRRGACKRKADCCLLDEPRTCTATCTSCQFRTKAEYLRGEGTCLPEADCCASERDCAPCHGCASGTCASQCSADQTCVRDVCTTGPVPEFFRAVCGCKRTEAGSAGRSVALEFAGGAGEDVDQCVAEPVQ